MTRFVTTRVNPSSTVFSFPDSTHHNDPVEAGLREQAEITGDPPLETVEELAGEGPAEVGLDDGPEGGPDQVGLGPAVRSRISGTLLLLLLGVLSDPPVLHPPDLEPAALGHCPLHFLRAPHVRRDVEPISCLFIYQALFSNEIAKFLLKQFENV